MFLTIFKKELLDQLINPKFLIVFLLCLILIPPSFLMNYANYRSDFSEYKFLKKTYEEDIESESVSFFSPQVFRKPSVLSTFGLGLERVLPKIISFKKYQIESKGTKAQHEIISNIVGKVDFIFIVSYLIGLFAILYASILIVSEKEAGTLKLIFANKTKRISLLLGKFLAGYIALIIPLLIAFLIGIILLIFKGFPLFLGENFLRILALLFISLLYLSTFFTLGLLISTRTEKTGVALIVSFLVWIFLVLVIPKISEPLANIVHPIQTYEIAEMNKTKLINQIELEKGERLAPLLMEFISSRDSLKYQKNRESIAKEYEEKIEKKIEKMNTSYEKEKEFNTNISLLFSRLSPSFVYTNSALNFCQTGLADRENFLKALKSHRIQLYNAYFQYVYRDKIEISIPGKGKQRASVGGMKKQIDRKTLPQFPYKFLKLSETISKSLIDLVLLIIYNLVFFSSAYFSFVRYDVR